jgi:hypothetical protein
MSKVLKKVAIVAGAVALIATGVGALGGLGIMTTATAGTIAPYSIEVASLKDFDMSAVGSLKTPNSAYLFADSGSWDADGRLTDLATKISYWKALGIGIAAQGPSYISKLVYDDLCQKLLIADQFDILIALPESVRAARNIRKANDFEEGTALVDFMLWVAAYDATEKRPRLYFIKTEGCPTFPDAEPYKLIEHEGFACPPPSADVIEKASQMTNAAQLAATLLSGQRHANFGTLPSACMVAGDGELLEISEFGVSLQTVIRFPEKIGERCNRELGGELTSV